MARRVVLHPSLLASLLDTLTDADMDDLCEATGKDPDTFIYRATEWLIRRFDLRFPPMDDIPEDHMVVVRRIISDGP